MDIQPPTGKGGDGRFFFKRYSTTSGRVAVSRLEAPCGLRSYARAAIRLVSASGPGYNSNLTVMPMAVPQTHLQLGPPVSLLASCLADYAPHRHCGPPSSYLCGCLTPPSSLFYWYQGRTVALPLTLIPRLILIGRTASPRWIWVYESLFVFTVLTALYVIRSVLGNPRFDGLSHVDHLAAQPVETRSMSGFHVNHSLLVEFQVALRICHHCADWAISGITMVLCLL